MEQLKKEIDKWTRKIIDERKRIVPADNGRKDFLKNIDAYISDSDYFLKEGKVIESFEALIWSWAYITIGKELGILTSKTAQTSRTRSTRTPLRRRSPQRRMLS